MQATKEKAQKAMEHVIVLRGNLLPVDPGYSRLLFLQEFVEAAGRILPSEERLRKEKDRKRRFWSNKKILAENRKKEASGTGTNTHV